MRYGDEQLYALARYLYALEPPPNPHRSDPLAARGKRVFEREGCATCHTPPLYTNNMLTPVTGFTPSDEDRRRFDVMAVGVGTDPGLALRTRRGTGYYKVPSLKGLWYRGPFEHSLWVATLEDWFDPRRTRDDYVPKWLPRSRRRAARGDGAPVRFFGLTAGGPAGADCVPEDALTLAVTPARYSLKSTSNNSMIARLSSGDNAGSDYASAVQPCLRYGRVYDARHARLLLLVGDVRAVPAQLAPDERIGRGRTGSAYGGR